MEDCRMLNTIICTRQLLRHTNNNNCSLDFEEQMTSDAFVFREKTLHHVMVRFMDEMWTNAEEISICNEVISVFYHESQKTNVHASLVSRGTRNVIQREHSTKNDRDKQSGGPFLGNVCASHAPHCSSIRWRDNKQCCYYCCITAYPTCNTLTSSRLTKFPCPYRKCQMVFSPSLLKIDTFCHRVRSRRGRGSQYATRGRCQ